MKRIMVFLIGVGLVFSMVAIGAPVKAEEATEPIITEKQKAAIVDYCSNIKEDLQNVQKNDARTRVYLGGYYETILSKFITPLNLRLIENDMPNTDLINSQEQFSTKKLVFMSNYISYQQALEELVGMDCKSEPEKFYAKLGVVRERRKMVNQDVKRMRELVEQYVKQVNKLKEKL